MGDGGRHRHGHGVCALRRYFVGFWILCFFREVHLANLLFTRRSIPNINLILILILILNSEIGISTTARRILSYPKWRERDDSTSCKQLAAARSIINQPPST
jgi:hypothetical protein